MISLKCSQCNAELLPDAKFCRRCGAIITAAVAEAAVNSSELPTATFSEQKDLTTRNLNPRVTSPETPRRTAITPVPSTPEEVGAQSKRRRWLLIGITVLLLCVIVASVAYVRITSHSRTTDDAALIYPGSQTIVDVASGDGRALQLRTDDSLEQVIAWYEKSIKPTKTMRLTSTSVVLKNDNVTTTVASEAGKTNILIKRIK